MIEVLFSIVLLIPLVIGCGRRTKDTKIKEKEAEHKKKCDELRKNHEAKKQAIEEEIKEARDKYNRVIMKSLDAPEKGQSKLKEIERPIDDHLVIGDSYNFEYNGWFMLSYCSGGTDCDILTKMEDYVEDIRCKVAIMMVSAGRKLSSIDVCFKPGPHNCSAWLRSEIEASKFYIPFMEGMRSRHQKCLKTNYREKSFNEKLQKYSMQEKQFKEYLEKYPKLEFYEAKMEKNNKSMVEFVNMMETHWARLESRYCTG